MAVSTGAAILGGSVISGMMGKRSADKASAAAGKASKAAIAEQRRQFDLIRGDTAKYRDVGGSALYGLADMMGLSYSNPYDEEIAKLEAQQSQPTRKGRGAAGAFAGAVMQKQKGDQQSRLQDLYAKRDAFNAREKYNMETSPGYQFRLEEGMKGLERSQAGRRLSGRAAKEAMRYGQGYASEEFGNQFSRLATLAGYGQAGVQTSAASNPANAISNIYSQQGQTQAQAAMAGGQAINQAVQGGLQNYMTWQQYNQ